MFIRLENLTKLKREVPISVYLLGLASFLRSKQYKDCLLSLLSMWLCFCCVVFWQQKTHYVVFKKKMLHSCRDLCILVSGQHVECETD
jgi:hypothetical protein